MTDDPAAGDSLVKGQFGFYYDGNTILHPGPDRNEFQSVLLKNVTNLRSFNLKLRPAPSG